MCLCTVLQPFGRALVEAGKAFFGMEQERGALRGLLEIHAGKCFDYLANSVLHFVHLCSLFFFLCSVTVL